MGVKIEKFEGLKIWQDSVELTLAIYTLFMDSKDSGFLFQNPIYHVWALKRKNFNMTQLIGQTLKTYSYSQYPKLFYHSNPFIHNYHYNFSDPTNPSNPLKP